MPWSIDFNQSMLVLNNAILNEDINSTASSSFRIELNSTVDPGIVGVSLPAGIAKDSSLTGNQPLSFKIGFGRPVTRLENLVAWWTFDEGNGSTVTDYMGGYIGNLINNVDGNVTFDNSNSKFGYALRFPKNAWVSTNAYPAAMGVGDGNPRTISFWMYAEQHANPNGSNRDYQTGIYGMGQRSNANGFHRMWGMRGLWDTANYRRIFSQHWGWDPQIYISEGVKNKWMHIAHQYTGTHVRAYVNGTLRSNWPKSNILTGNIFPLQFGRFTEENRNDRTFKGLLDDFRVYNAALSSSDISRLYSGGYGDFNIRSSFDVDLVVEGNPSAGKVTFSRGGELVDVNDFNSSQGDLSISGGTIVPGSIKRESLGIYSFEFFLDQENVVSQISITNGSVYDEYNQTNVPSIGQPGGNSIATRKMYRAVTRGENLVAWWPFDTDAINSNQAVSKTAGMQEATLYDASISSFGRFGRGVRFRKDQPDARIRVENNGITLGSAWTLTAWARNLFPPSAGGRSSLYRGQDKLSDNDYDRYFCIRGSDRMVCLFDGDVGWGPNRYRPSGYQLNPLGIMGWRHFSVLGKGSRTRFFVDGLFVGEADRRDQSDVYYIGNSSTGEAFAEYLDDIRIYNVSLEDYEISKIYGGGFGDQFTSVKIEDNSTADSSPRKLKVSFGKDGQPVVVPSLSEFDIGLSAGEVIEVNSTIEGSSYLISLLPDTNSTRFSINAPSVPIQFENLSLWLDANDSNLDIPPFVLWLDANDSGTITHIANSVSQWSDKSGNNNHAVQLTEASKPTIVNNKIQFDGLDDGLTLTRDINQIKLSVFFVVHGHGYLYSNNGSERTLFYDSGAGHNLWWRVNNNEFFSNTSVAPYSHTATQLLEFSLKPGNATLHVNGAEVLNQSSVSGNFKIDRIGLKFDGTTGVSTWSGEIMEIIAISNTIYRQTIEGYLAHKWGFSSSLPGDHPFKTKVISNLGDGVWKDKSLNLNHSFEIGSPTLLNNEQNGMSVMSYSGTNSESHSFNMIQDIRTVFWVISEDPSVSSSDFRYLLGDTTKQPDWHNNGDGNIWGTTWGDSQVFNGYTRLNGAVIDGKQTSKPTNLSIISLRTLGNVQSDNFSNDRNAVGGSWKGKLAELLIYNTALSDSNIEKVEGYLAHKWGLSSNLPSNHSQNSQADISMGSKFTFDSNLSVESLVLNHFSHERVYKEEELLSRWRFEEEFEIDGKKVSWDVAKARNHGFLEGDASLGNGLFGRGLVLDGNGDYFEIPHFRGLFEDGNFTLCAWVYLDDIGVDNDQHDGAIFAANGNDLKSMLLWYDVNSLSAANRSFSFNLGATEINLNRLNAPDSLAVQGVWHHFAVSVNQKQHSIYLDGVEVVRTDFAGNANAHIEGNTLRIGSWNSNSNYDFSGVLDDVRIYDSALNPNDLSILYGNGIGDLGVVPMISVDGNHSGLTVAGKIEFYQFGQSVSVTDFNQSDINIIGGSLSSFTPNGNEYLFIFSPDEQPSRMTVSLTPGAAKYGSIGSSAVSKTFSQHSAVTGMDSLALWYAFEEDNGSSLVDFSTSAIDGDLTGGIRVPGKFGQSLSLSLNDFVTANGESLSLSNSLTLSVWSKTLDDAQGVLIRSGQFSLEYHDDNTIRGSIYTENSWKEVKARSYPGQWTHYALTYDGVELKLYTNGTQSGNLLVSGYLSWGDGIDHNLYLGRYGLVGWDAKTELDDVRVYRKAFSSEEILSLYGNGSGDVGIRPLVEGDSPFSSQPVSQTVSFYDGNSSMVISNTDLAEGEVNASGGIISSFSYASNNYTYDLNATTNPSMVRISIPQGAVVRDGNQSQAVAFEFQHRIVTTVENDLLAWYPVDKFDGNLTTDKSGRMQHAVALGFSGNPTTSAGMFGQALDLNGEYLALPFRIDQSSTSQGLTFSAWIKPDQVMGGVDNERILFSTDDGGWDWSTSIRYGALSSWTGVNRFQSPLQVFPNQWSHVVSVFDPIQGRAILYLNGGSAAINSIGFDNSASFLRIGWEPNGRSYDGLIDDIRVWGRPLSSPEVDRLWGNGMGDLGPRFDLGVENPTYGTTIRANALFNQPIGDFNASVDLEHLGLNLESATLDNDSNTSWTLIFEPASYTDANYSIKLKANSVTDSFGLKNSEVVKQIEFRPHRLREADLLLWWNLDEGSGGIASDSSSLGLNDGNASGVLWGNPGKFGTGHLVYDKTNDRAVKLSSGINEHLSSVTLSLWVYPQSSNFYLFSLDGFSPDLSISLINQRPLFSMDGLNQQSLPGTSGNEFWASGYLPLNDWSHLTLTYSLDNRRVRFYLNGLFEGEASFANAQAFPLGQSFRLGPQDGAQSIATEGRIDDFRIYGVELNATEVSQVYGSGNGDFYNRTIEFSFDSAL